MPMMARRPARVIVEVREARNMAVTAFRMVRREIESVQHRLEILKSRERALLVKLAKAM